MSTASTIRELKDNDEDFEWYPTTDEIILKVSRDITYTLCDKHYEKIDSIMDIGAGDGRVLKAIQSALQEAELNSHNSMIDCYAIEKAIHHLNNMPKDINVVGTDFEQQTLVDKHVDAIFCNPPYSQFEEWTLRIVREASAKYLYLVIPQRWRESIKIKHALEARSSEVTSLGEFDFENADRRARARVEVIRIEYAYGKKDAFESVIEDMLPELDVFEMELEPETIDFNTSMINGGKNLVEVLVEAYDADMLSMLENYKAALRINARILSELGIKKAGVLESIKLKIKGLKDKYWQALFDEMDTITQRLATKQRSAFLKSLKEKVAIDFTENNIYSILIWVSKWANDFFDEQLIELFRTLSTDSCVVRYKSNQRVWSQTGWRYGNKNNFSGEDGSASHYKLEYRIVLTHGGICTSSYNWRKDQCRGLEERSFDMLQDIVTVANNLGFQCKDKPGNYQWESNVQNKIMLTNGEPLVAVRAFKNGNMHLHFNQKVILAINVEAGRLLKWIRNPAEACKEMDVQGEDVKRVTKMFGSSFRIAPDSGFLKLTDSGNNPEEAHEPEPMIEETIQTPFTGIDWDAILGTE